MDAHAERLYKAFHNPPAAMRENVRAELDSQLKQRSEALTRRLEQERASRLLSEPILRKVFQEAQELALPAPPKLAPAAPPIKIPRPEKSWLKHGSVFMLDVPPFDDAFASGTVTGGGITHPQASTDGFLNVNVDCLSNNGGTATSFAAVAMNYSPPGPSCRQGVTNGLMTARTSVSFSWGWVAGSKLWAAGVVDLVIGMQVQKYDISGNLIEPIGDQFVSVVSENFQDFLNQGGASNSGTLSLATHCNVSNLFNYSVLVTAFADASAWGGFGNPGFFESFSSGFMQVHVPFMEIDIIYP
jgi:hypothetical protein